MIVERAPGAGALALLGSGEYTPAMDRLDRALLAGSSALGPPRVVVLPTAAGMEEPSSPQQWTRRGLDHFGRLSAPVEGVAILTRDDAHDPRWLPLLEAATLIYFSGGSPHHLVETLTDTPAWAAITRRHAQGAALAGCSAGAMAFGGQTARPGALRAEGAVQWWPALGLLPRLIMLPHFDRLATYIGAEALDRSLRSIPTGMTLLGIDEETALLRPAAPHPEPGGQGWQVVGRGAVALITPNGGHTVYQAGQMMPLEPGE